VLAKKNDVKSARILAKELVRANKQRDRLVSSKARMGSVQMQLQHQLCEFKSPARSWVAHKKQRRDFGRAKLFAEVKGKTDHSHGESHGGLPEEYGDHENDKPTYQATTAERDNAGNEYGNDEGVFVFQFLLLVRAHWIPFSDAPLPLRHPPIYASLFEEAGRQGVFAADRSLIPVRYSGRNDGRNAGHGR